MTARFVDRTSGQEVGRVTLTSRDRASVRELAVDGSEDTRELGIALEDVELRNEPAEDPPGGARSRWTGARSAGPPPLASPPPTFYLSTSLPDAECRALTRGTWPG